MFKAIEDNLDAATDLTKRLAKVVFGSSGTETTSVAKPKKKKFTVPKPFNLHKPKQPTVPEPMRIESRVKVKIIPQSTYTNSLEKLNARNQTRREKIREKIVKKHDEYKAFEFPENKTDLEGIREARRKAEMAECKFEFKAKPVRVGMHECQNLIRRGMCLRGVCAGHYLTTIGGGGVRIMFTLLAPSLDIMMCVRAF